MKQRTRAILRLLHEADGYTTIERLAEQTEAGVRTVHRDLEKLERGLALRGVRLERRRGQGVRLLDPVPEEVLASGFGLTDAEGPDSEDRPQLMLLFLIAAGDWIKVSELAHVFFVSDSSVLSDLDGLVDRLPDQIRLERQKGVGVRIVGDEMTLRRMFLVVFPTSLPLYRLRYAYLPLPSGDRTTPGPSHTAYRRIIEGMGLLEDADLVATCLTACQQTIGVSISPAHESLLYGYLFLVRRRIAKGHSLTVLPRFQLSLPELFARGARVIAGSELFDSSLQDAEVEGIARLLAACDVSQPPTESLAPVLGDLAPHVQAVIERTLGVIEEREHTWLHDDRALLDYLRCTVAAAVRRIDLGLTLQVPTPAPKAHQLSQESIALTSEFLAVMSSVVGRLAPAHVAEELIEASLALGARVEAIHRRRSRHLAVRILSYEGLGMSSYLSAVARAVLPPGSRIDSEWDPEFATDQRAASYDLVVTTYPLQLSSVPVLNIAADSPPEVIRARLREMVDRIGGSGVHEEQRVEEPSFGSDSPQNISLPVIMAVIDSFVVKQLDPAVPIVVQALSVIDRADCDRAVLERDFRRREGFGSLVFDEVGIRLVHCRTQGVPEPRAGVLQSQGPEPTALVLAAPIAAPASETRVLSEMVVALTETPDFAHILSTGTTQAIRTAMLSVFSRLVG